MAQLAVLGRRWRVGTFATVDWFRGFIRLPAAYLHEVHNVLSRQPDNETARMHMLVAGGLVSSLATTFLL
jgi:hypothetical protein